MSFLNSFAPAIFGLLGTAIGGVATYLAQIGIRRNERRSQRNSVAYALAAEIEALIAITRDNGYVARFEQIAEEMEKGNRQQLRGQIAAFDPSRDPFPIMRAHVGNFGLMGDYAGQLAQFYVYTLAIRATWTMGDHGSYDGLPAEDQAKIIRSMLKRWQETEKLGEHLVRHLRSFGQT